MAKGFILMASTGIIAAAGLGHVVALLTAESPFTGPSAAPVVGAAAAVAELKAGTAPDPEPAKGADVNVAETQAATKQAKQTPYGLWVVSCMAAAEGAPANCAARLAIKDNQRKVVIVNWLIGYPSQSRSRSMALRTVSTPLRDLKFSAVP